MLFTHSSLYRWITVSPRNQSWSANQSDGHAMKNENRVNHVNYGKNNHRVIITSMKSGKAKDCHSGTKWFLFSLHAPPLHTHQYSGSKNRRDVKTTQVYRPYPERHLEKSLVTLEFRLLLAATNRDLQRKPIELEHSKSFSEQGRTSVLLCWSNTFHSLADQGRMTRGGPTAQLFQNQISS